MASLPIIDLDIFRTAPDSAEAHAEAGKTAESLIRYGALIVKDSRVSEDANSRFLDVMEDYFAQDEGALKVDARPEYHFQVGVTLENTEKPKCHSSDSCKAVISSLDPSERPLDLEGGKADPKCRFFHRMGVTPPTTSFPSLSMENVTPAAFSSTWEASMTEWGTQIQGAVEGVSQALAVGLGLQQNTFTEAATYGSHLLAPTSTDLNKYGRVGEIFAGFHTDLNALTIHGRSRYPGLHIWARNTGKRIVVKLPPGHLLVQAGKQIEHLTNGLILAGYHEVVCTPETVAAMERRQQDPATADRPLNRISSTFFWHFSSDYEMRPQEFLGRMQGSEVVRREQVRVLANAEEGSPARVPRETYEEGMKVGSLVQNELKHIALMKE